MGPQTRRTRAPEGSRRPQTAGRPARPEARANSRCAQRHSERASTIPLKSFGRPPTIGRSISGHPWRTAHSTRAVPGVAGHHLKPWRSAQRYLALAAIVTTFYTDPEPRPARAVAHDCRQGVTRNKCCNRTRGKLPRRARERS